MKQPSDRKILVAVIFGPTAVGKSSVAVEVARARDAEIVSADSMQIYRGLPILTDQPSTAMQSEVRHHLVGIIPLNEDYSAARFAREAGSAIREIAGRKNLPLLVGGTGLYLRSLLGGFSFAARGVRDERNKWRELIRAEGVRAAFQQLQQMDPVAAGTIDAHNPRRVARALEAAAAAAECQGAKVTAERHRLWSSESPYRVLSFGLVAPRAEIYLQIEERVDRMLSSGAIEEVLAARNVGISETAAKAIGFEDISAYIDGLVSIDIAAASIKQKSRRYAKRQLTWMRKMPDIVRIDVAGRTPKNVARAIIERIHDTSG